MKQRVLSSMMNLKHLYVGNEQSIRRPLDLILSLYLRVSEMYYYYYCKAKFVRLQSTVRGVTILRTIRIQKRMGQWSWGTDGPKHKSSDPKQTCISASVQAWPWPQGFWP
jgi:hypothetical protein